LSSFPSVDFIFSDPADVSRGAFYDESQAKSFASGGEGGEAT